MPPTTPSLFSVLMVVFSALIIFILGLIAFFIQRAYLKEDKRHEKNDAAHDQMEKHIANIFAELRVQNVKNESVLGNLSTYGLQVNSLFKRILNLEKNVYQKQ